MGNRRFPLIFSLICVAWLLPGLTLFGQPQVQLPPQPTSSPSTAPNVGAGAPYGTPPYGTTPYGTTPYGTTPYGTTPYGTAPYGMAPTYYTPSATSFDPYFRPSTAAPMFNSPNWNLENLFNY